MSKKRADDRLHKYIFWSNICDNLGSITKGKDLSLMVNQNKSI